VARPTRRCKRNEAPAAEEPPSARTRGHRSNGTATRSRVARSRFGGSPSCFCRGRTLLVRRSQSVLPAHGPAPVHRSRPLHPRDQLSARVGPVLDRLTIWPVDDGRYGLGETFEGAGGFERARHHEQQLEHRGMPFSFRQKVMVAGHGDSARSPRSTSPSLRPPSSTEAPPEPGDRPWAVAIVHLNAGRL